MKGKYVKVLSFWLLVALISTFITVMSSCSTRKTTIDKVQKDSLSQISTKIITEEIVKIETKNNIVTDEFTITPLDTCKDFVVNGVTYRNAVLKYKKTKDNTIQVENKKVSNKEVKTQDTKVAINVRKKYIEKPSNPLLNLLWLLIPIAGYLIYRKYGR